MNTENKEITIVLNYYLGRNVRSEICRHINFLLDNAIYFDDFHLVVSNRELEVEEIDVLIRSLQKKNGLETNYFKKIVDLIHENTGYVFFNGSDFLVIDQNEIYVTDNLKVYRITDNKILWKTPRVSYDGIELNSVDEKYLYGSWNSLSGENYDEWDELVLERSTGMIIKGKTIEIYDSRSTIGTGSNFESVRKFFNKLIKGFLMFLIK